jgi:hypothetical protein
MISLHGAIFSLACTATFRAPRLSSVSQSSLNLLLSQEARRRDDTGKASRRTVPTRVAVEDASPRTSRVNPLARAVADLAALATLRH